MSPADLPADALDPEADEDPSKSLVELWRGEIERYRDSAADWTKKAEAIIKRYRLEHRKVTAKTKPRYNVLWSNIQTMAPAIYAMPPKPVVQRPFRDRDPIGRIACRILERVLTYQVEAGGLHETMELNVLDKLLAGRGTCWLRYDPVIVGALPEATGGEGQTADEPPDNEQIADETVHVDYVHWRDFAHEPGRFWKEVSWVARRVYMDRQALIDRFGEDVANDVPLTFSADRRDSDEMKKAKNSAKAEKAGVWEIWNKAKKELIWIADDYDQILDQKDDPYHLQGFFPCPCPLYATTTTDSLIPVPDSEQYKPQADELDLLTTRIQSVVHALKVRGAYGLQFPELAAILKGDENDMIGIEAWDNFTAQGGMKGAMDFVPIDMLAKVLDGLYKARDEVKGEINEISGLADILRGQGDASETATGVNAKGRFATLRLKDQQDTVARYVRDVVRLMAEIICELFQPEVMAEQAACQEMEDLQIPAPPPMSMSMPPQMPPQGAAVPQRLPMMAGGVQ